MDGQPGEQVAQAQGCNRLNLDGKDYIDLLLWLSMNACWGNLGLGVVAELVVAQQRKGVLGSKLQY